MKTSALLLALATLCIVSGASFGHETERSRRMRSREKNIVKVGKVRRHKPTEVRRRNNEAKSTKVPKTNEMNVRRRNQEKMAKSPKDHAMTKEVREPKAGNLKSERISRETKNGGLKSGQDFKQGKESDDSKSAKSTKTESLYKTTNEAEGIKRGQPKSTKVVDEGDSSVWNGEDSSNWEEGVRLDGNKKY